MKIVNKKNKKAFTLIELLVVIAIIGILTALAVVSLQNSRRSARDAKRLADVKQLQIALELYYQDNSNYPSTLLPGDTLASNSITYMETIPYPPTIIDGDCSTSSYTYSTSNDQSYYNIHFCLSNSIGSLPAGEVVASPRGLGTWTCGERLLDERDNQSYATVQIGSQCWMAENLNIGTRIESNNTSTKNSIIEKYCLNNVENNCNIYGGLYQWDEAMKYDENNAQGICPDGWYIPTWNEINNIASFLSLPSNSQYQCGGNPAYISKSLASASGWNSSVVICAVGNNQSTNNTTGFSALQSGYRQWNSGGFGGGELPFWSSTSYLSDKAYYRRIHYLYNVLDGSTISRSYGIAVRCLKN